jgi:hypothetical protein
MVDSETSLTGFVAVDMGLRLSEVAASVVKSGIDFAEFSGPRQAQAGLR